MELSELRSIHAKDEILSELISSSTNANVVGLLLSGEDELITTAVIHILNDGLDPLIYFKECDLHGYPITQNPCRLSNVKNLVRFKTKFDDPIYLKIRERNQHAGAAA
jgi:hypothetical protein